MGCGASTKAVASDFAQHDVANDYLLDQALSPEILLAMNYDESGSMHSFGTQPTRTSRISIASHASYRNAPAARRMYSVGDNSKSSRRMKDLVRKRKEGQQSKHTSSEDACVLLHAEDDSLSPKIGGLASRRKINLYVITCVR
mmetsp:Transcript_11731/g.18590  ORF Transcript_11731/g.18590 Transcript_11731/m.18590 type:complete len:143 (+) Transcript_11731:29-457(+)